MVVLLNLNNDQDLLTLHGKHDQSARFHKPHLRGLMTTRSIPRSQANGDEHDRPNPNVNSFSAALACYPIVSQLTRSLDLNTLHALSRTCRQFRVNLLQYRKQLIAHSLRCSNDCLTRNNTQSLDIKEVWPGLDPSRYVGLRRPRCKVTACARDMVSDCRRCGQTVCRNCSHKLPSLHLISTLPKRHRRLCPVCLAAPLHKLTDSHLSTSLVIDPLAFTASAFIRDACSCSNAVFLCQNCSRGLPNADITYERIWTWRTRYSTYLGGLGTGIGEGNEGVKCGRGPYCLAAEDKELEIDCGIKELSHPVGKATEAPPRESGEESCATGNDKAGYLRQEIEGIGGVVRKKVKKRVKVGKTVAEHEDERERADYLAREKEGRSRSWCNWCDRVILGAYDVNHIPQKCEMEYKPG